RRVASPRAASKKGSAASSSSSSIVTRSQRKRMHEQMTDDYLPILDLPNEIISNVFSSLGMKDRLRARVNKKMNAIELESKYHVKEVLIEERSERRDPGTIRWWDIRGQLITFYEDKSYSSHCIKIICQNVSIGKLKIELTGSSEFHREVYNLLKDFEIGHLDFGPVALQHQILKEMMVDSFFLDLTKACKILHIDKCDNVTPEAFHQVYKNMTDGSTRLIEFFTRSFAREKWITFLNFIEITFRRGRFFSNRDIEVCIRRSISGHDHLLIFDGSVEITIIDRSPFEQSGMKFKLHENRESLENAKNTRGLDKINVHAV
ncbi:hypothetical protein PENTCL1PPCAC_19403, partial [Pristionchus entomophagus]